MVFWADNARHAKSLHFQKLPRASTFVKSIFATTHMHAATFAPNLLNDLRAIAVFAFTQLPSIWAAFMLALSSCCTYSVAPALRDTYGTALMQQHPEDDMQKEAKGPTRWSHSDLSAKVSIEVWDSCLDIMCTCRRLQLNKMPAHFCVAQYCIRSCFNAVSEFSPFVRNFPSFPHSRENSGMITCPWRSSSKKKNRECSNKACVSKVPVTGSVPNKMSEW